MPRTRKPEPECECGNAKEPYEEACPRCKFLDGDNRAARQQRIICSLRVHERLSVEQLADEVGSAPEGVQRALYLMLEAGRVRRSLVDGPCGSRNGLTGKYVYSLTTQGAPT